MKRLTLFTALFLFLQLTSFDLFSQCNISGSSTIEVGETTTYATSSGGNFFWSVTGGLVINSPNTGASVSVSGTTVDPTAKVCVTRFQAGQEPCCSCLTVSVEPPCVPATSVDITIEPEDACPGDEITFTASIFPGDATFNTNNFHWEGGVGSPSSAPIIEQEDGKTFTWNTPVASQIWVRVTYKSCDGSTVVDLIIIEECCIPITSLWITQIEIPGQGCPGDEMEFVANYLPPNATFDPSNLSWEGGEGFISPLNVIQTQSGGISFLFDTPASGQAWVRVTYQDCDGSTKVALTLVNFEDCLKKEIPPGLSSPVNPNNNLPTGQVSPNPFSDRTSFRFNMEESAEVTLEIYNLKGEVFFSNTALYQKGQQQIEIQNLPEKYNGLMFYRLKTNNQIIDTGKLIRSN